MTLSQPTAVAYAVASGQPSDAREWISVDLAGYPEGGRRGYVVTTEPMNQSGRARELAGYARMVILDELRRLRQSPPDVALGRAFAAANAAIHEQVRTSGGIGADQRPLIGASAAIFEDHTVTVAHVPPGQIILVEDGLIYAVPKLESWFSHFANTVESKDSPEPEPLGFANYTAPIIAQTEVDAGDTIVFATAGTGQVFAEEVIASGFGLQDLRYLHHRDPDNVLDIFKGIVIARDLQDSATAVIGFPPMGSEEQMLTLADVGRRTRERWRHGRAMANQWRPRRTAALQPDESAVAVEEGPIEETIPTPAEAETPSPSTDLPIPEKRNWRQPGKIFQERAERIFANRNPNQTWEQQTEVQRFGLPRTHGVAKHRAISQPMGERTWRHGLPRLPIIGSAWIWPVLAMIIIGMAFGALTLRDRYLTRGLDVDAELTAIDARIEAAIEADSNTDTVNQLAIAQTLIDDAREDGVEETDLIPRQRKVTEELDKATNVIRMSDVQRVGSLPDEFNEDSVQAIYSQIGIFFATGSLYQWQIGSSSGTPNIVKILEQGSLVEDVPVGDLYGIAIDAKGLYVTDGDYVFMLNLADQQWKAVQLEKINNQSWEKSAMGAFDGSVYLLQPDGSQIYRFDIDGSDASAEPVDWLVTGARDLIPDVTDMAIATDIYLCVGDGQILDMRLGDTRKAFTPNYMITTDEDGGTARIIYGSQMGYLYAVVIDGDESRIVAFDPEGGNAHQLKLPIDFPYSDLNVSPPFTNLRDVVIDESSGTIYIINGDGIWTARYSLPELPAEPAATPEA